MDLERRARAQLQVNEQTKQLEGIMAQAFLSFRSLAVEHDRHSKVRFYNLVSQYARSIAAILSLLHPVLNFTGSVVSAITNVYACHVTEKEYAKRLCFDPPAEIADLQYLTFEDRKVLATNQVKVTDFLIGVLESYPGKYTKIDSNVPTLTYL